MAKFSIKTKDGRMVRYEGYPRYNGNYLKVSSIDFGTISSPVKIDWQVGDYIDYTRTGMRYKLYSLPSLVKQARSGSCGDAFVYSNVVFYPKTKELELALFRDYVIEDNEVHFSTQNSVSTYESAYGIVDRVRACLDKEYPNEWEVRVFDNLDDDFVEKISESMEFSVTGSVLDACDKIYELWGMGWIHDIEDGKNVLLFGRPNKRDSSNTTDKYLYGMGKGLTSIKKNITNAGELASRVYAYGSSRNMVAKYYADKGIKDAESVDIRHLMIPFQYWGKTDNLPDASKAYIEEADKVAELGRIAKIIYFDGSEYPEIYPSLEKVTIGDIKGVMEPDEQYYPDESWPDTWRVDKLMSAQIMDDDGTTSGTGGTKYLQTKALSIAMADRIISDNGVHKEEWVVFEDVEMTAGTIVKALNSITLNMQEYDENVGNVVVKVIVSDDHNTIELGAYVEHNLTDNTWTATTDMWSFRKSSGPIKMSVEISVYPSSTQNYYLLVSVPTTTFTLGATNEIGNSFWVTVPQLGFDVNEMASLTSGGKCTIAMKGGTCGGRQFPVSAVHYLPVYDTWEFVCDRVYDEALGLYFPNSDYQLDAGDEYVLLDIIMPDIYVDLASVRLYSEAQKVYADISRAKYMYEPEIDAKKMIEEGWELREGMYMHLEDADIIDGTTHNEYMLIDSLTINEGGSAIPTYKVTLREERAESFIKSTTQRLDNIESKVAIASSQSVEYASRAGSASYAREARNAERWGEHAFKDMMDQPVRTGDSVAFQSIVTWALRSREFAEGVLGSGFKIEKDDNGNYTLELDNIVVRKALQVYELVIQQIRHPGGVVFQSAASIECTRVSFSQTGFKCYFDNQQGSVSNQFVVGDLARCQRFDLGTTDAKYYWRAVTEVGDDYIVLSRTDADTGSGNPAVGDVIVQCGNKTDAQRQAVKITYAVGEDSPRDEYYKGVNSYDLTGKLVTVVGVKDGQVGVYTENGSFKGVVEISAGSKGAENLQDASGRTIIVGGYIRTDMLDVDNIVVKQLNTNPDTGTDSIQIKDNEITIKDVEGRIKAAFHSKELGNMTGNTVVDVPLEYMAELRAVDMHAKTEYADPEQTVFLEPVWNKEIPIMQAMSTAKIVHIPKLTPSIVYHHEDGSPYFASLGYEFYITNRAQSLITVGVRHTAYKVHINAEQALDPQALYDDLLPFFPDESAPDKLQSIIFDGEDIELLLTDTVSLSGITNVTEVKRIAQYYGCQISTSRYYEYAVGSNYSKDLYFTLPAGYKLFMRLRAMCEDYPRTYIEYTIPAYTVSAMDADPRLEIGSNGLVFYHTDKEMVEMKMEDNAMVVRAQNTLAGFELTSTGLRMKLGGTWYGVSRTTDGFLKLT